MVFSLQMVPSKKLIFFSPILNLWSPIWAIELNWLHFGWNLKNMPPTLPLNLLFISMTFHFYFQCLFRIFFKSLDHVPFLKRLFFSHGVLLCHCDKLVVYSSTQRIYIYTEGTAAPFVFNKSVFCLNKYRQHFINFEKFT